MKRTPIALLAASIAFLNGCSSMKVATEQTAEFDFAAVKTYEWVKAPAKILDEDDTILSDKLHQLLNNELAGRGWTQVLESDQADIQVIYYIKLSEHEEYTTPPTSSEPQVTSGFTYNNNTGTWGSSDQTPDLNVYTVEVGQLTLLIHDTISDEIVWRGTLRTKIDRGAALEKRQRLLGDVARKIVSKIP